MKGSGIKDRKRMSQVAVLKTKNCKPNPKGGFRQTDVGKDCRRKSGNGTCQARLPGQFLSLKQDKKTRTFLFTGAYQKLEVPAKDAISVTIPIGTLTRLADNQD